MGCPRSVQVFVVRDNTEIQALSHVWPCHFSSRPPRLPWADLQSTKYLLKSDSRVSIGQVCHLQTTSHSSMELGLRISLSIAWDSAVSSSRSAPLSTWKTRDLFAEASLGLLKDVRARALGPSWMWRRKALTRLEG